MTMIGLSAVKAANPDSEWIEDAERVAQLSQDFNWYSPVLKAELADKRAEAVVRPRTEAEIRQLVSACAQHQVPITVRGAGTGNYGQCVPLQGGLILDMSRYNAFLWSTPGVARAQAGLKCMDLDRETQPLGWEMRCMPSTFRTATLGGLFGGGFGGIGSINYGPLSAAGNVLGVRAMSVEPEPQSVELRGANALRLHHGWGTNGIILELELGLAPAQPWMDAIVVFKDFEQTLRYADALAHAPGIIKKNLSIMGDPVPRYLTPLADYLPEACHAVLVIFAEYSQAAFKALTLEHGGDITYWQTPSDIAKNKRLLAEFNWNHTTLHALKVDSNLTYLQTLHTPGQHLEQMRLLKQAFGEEMLFHVQFIRTADGLMTSCGLPMVHYRSAERLKEITQFLRDHEIQVDDAHTYRLELGFHLGDDTDQADDTNTIRGTKRRFDPLGLLNPGKLVNFEAASS